MRYKDLTVKQEDRQTCKDLQACKDLQICKELQGREQHVRRVKAFLPDSLRQEAVRQGRWETQDLQIREHAAAVRDTRAARGRVPPPITEYGRDRSAKDICGATSRHLRQVRGWLLMQKIDKLGKEGRQKR